LLLFLVRQLKDRYRYRCKVFVFHLKTNISFLVLF
jgi:hypothetical protein